VKFVESSSSPIVLPRPNEVWQLAQQGMTGLGMARVYRTLEALTKEGCLWFATHGAMYLEDRFTADN
jgi:Fe2+ or Zn2+ uptake regulation protein